MPSSILEEMKARLGGLVDKAGLRDTPVSVRARPLTAVEAIGTPTRQDFPIVKGKEKVIEVSLLDARAHAFTDEPGEFEGTLGAILGLPLESNRNRAIFVGTLNAFLAHLGLTRGTIHCRDDDPEKCGAEVVKTLRERAADAGGPERIGIIGLNPAIVDALVDAFGAAKVSISDLDASNIGTEKFGVTIVDGTTENGRLIERSDVVIVTGTTLVNGTFDTILDSIEEHGKDFFLFGVTAGGICSLKGLNRICPYGRDE